MTTSIKLCSHDACTGCFACEGICSKKAITQVIDDEGFRHPRINSDRCIACHACERVCPIINPVKKNRAGDVFAAWSLDDTIRLKSSSGGIYSELAIAILKDNGVVVGASMNVEGYVYHTVISGIEEINNHRGSKYVQSMLTGDVYKSLKSVIGAGRKILFTGCPCQVAAARSYFKDSPLLYTMDIVCHGVPSPEAFAKIYADIKSYYPNLVSYNFRKLDSWGVCGSVNINININNIITNLPLKGKFTLYQDAFLKGLMHRPNCYNCIYATVERIGDISVADFWGIGAYRPIREDYVKGCSMVSVNSFKGRELFDSVSDRIYSEERDIQETIDGGNEQIVKIPEKPEGRDTFYQDLYSLDYTKLIHKYKLEILKNRFILQKITSKIKRVILRFK